MNWRVAILVVAIGLLAGTCFGLRADVNGDGIVNFGDLAIMASEWLEEEAMSVKIGIIGDIGFSDGDNIENWKVRGYRRFWDDEPTNSVDAAAARWTAAKNTFNSESVDAVVAFGAHVWDGVTNGDHHTTDTEALGLLQDAVDISELLDSEVYNTPVDRDALRFDGEGAAPDMDDWFSETGLVGGGHNQGAISSPHPDSDNPYSYYFEVGGIRFIFLRSETSTVEEAVVTWLEDTALNTNLPCVVMSSRYLTEKPGGWGVPAPGTGFFIGNYEEIHAAFVTAGNVQAVFQVSLFYGINVNTKSDSWVVDDIPYLIFDGAVFAPVAEDNRYYIIEIVPNAVYTTNGRKANIKVTGYGLANERTKDFDSYVVAG
jgi:hypothetical protein